jgi:hypothetical protein
MSKKFNFFLMAGFLFFCVSCSSFGVLGDYFEKNDLYSIQNRFGKSLVIQEGDAANSKSYICYQFEKGRYLFFFSDSELAKDNKITEIEIIQPNSKVSYKNCSSTLVSWIDLGLKSHTRKEILRQLNVSSMQGNQYQNNECKKKYMEQKSDLLFWKNKSECFKSNEKPYSDVCKSIDLEFDGEELIHLKISVTETVC